jgi:homoserine kinase
LLGANALLGGRFDRHAVLELAREVEGHADNAAAALSGGLVLVVSSPREPLLIRPISIPRWQVAVAIPQIRLSTADARAVLPKTVPLQAAAANIGRAAMVVEALRSGDSDLLRAAVQDGLHQPFRLPLIPGAGEAIEMALQAGAAAAALSGAGPGVIAFLPPGNPEFEAQVQAAMLSVFERRGVPARGFLLPTSQLGAAAETNPPTGEL